MTIIANLTPFIQGDDLTFDLKFKDDRGDALNVVGDTLYLTLKKDINVEDSDADMQVVLNVVADGKAEYGLVEFKVSRVQSNIPAGHYQFDYQWVKNGSGGGEVTTEYRGIATVLQGVTKT